MLPTGVEHWPVPTPFPVGDVNAWYLPGKVPTLIDPGPKTPQAWAALDRHLKTHPIKRVVFTHHHVDHAGLAARVRRDHSAEVWCHGKEADVLEHWGERAQERETDYEQGLVRAGVPENHREHMRYGGRRYDQLAENVRIDRRLDEGDRIELGDRSFLIHHVPGHTEGSILLRPVDGGFSFTGDTLLARITPNALSVRASERSALPDYLATLRRLKEMELGTVLPGHGSMFDNATQVISAGLRHAQLRQDRIRRLLVEKAGTAYQVAQRLFPRLPDDQQFLAISETLGHLECLRREGRISVEETGSEDLYKAA